MTTQTLIIPGLAVDDDLFERAVAGLAAHVPGHAPLTWDRFTDPAGWALVPDDVGDAYKAEFVLLNTIPATLKINIWMLPDLRGGAVEQPHSHPWRFRGCLLAGGYTENRWDTSGHGMVEQRGVHHQEGDVNEIGLDTYHEVVDIDAPGRTMSLMVCDRGQRGRWGYLDLATGKHTRAELDPTFSAKFAALNPHLRA